MGASIEIPWACADGEVISRSLLRPELFGAIFDRHFRSIHRYLARRVGNVRAEDLASHTFTVAFERRGSFRGAELDARPWLFGIATNLLRNERRAEQRLLETLARLQAEPDPGPPGGQESDLDIDCALAAALAELDAEQRDVLLLHAWAGLSYEETAAALGLPIGTVRSRLARARAHVRARLTTTAAVPTGAETADGEESP